ncbi:hypothetical protein AB0M39_02390 [Streptomyces sp. NPDC051907]|uniref:hypothetical protein n=1 Tax=Streptomyces sp. NPDC051907 TaxID=3155284 RepID=UPI00341D48E2
MINLEFSVRPDQGDPSGFDLGDMTITGDLGAADSRGHYPDQGMMIYLTVPLLLYGLGRILRGEERRLRFIGIDTSFRVDFHRNKKGVSLSANRNKITNIEVAELASAVLLAAEALADSSLPTLPEKDVAKSDYLNTLNDFKALTASISK